MTTYPAVGEIVAVQTDRRSQLLLGAMVCDRQNGHVTVKFASGNHFRFPLAQVEPAPQWIVDEYHRIAGENDIA